MNEKEYMTWPYHELGAGGYEGSLPPRTRTAHVDSWVGEEELHATVVSLVGRTVEGRHSFNSFNVFQFIK